MNGVSIRLGVETGEFISGLAAAERAVSSTSKAMKKAEKDGDWTEYMRLQMQRDSLAAGTSVFQKDTQKLFNDPRYMTTTSSGATVFKMDQDTASKFENLNDTLKKLTADYEKQINSHDIAAADATFLQIKQTQGEMHKAMEQAAAPSGMQAMAGAMKAVGIERITSAINEGFSRWAGSLDRSGIVGQYGNGDIWGGRVAEERRQADLLGGVAQGGLGLAGTIAGFFLPGGPLAWGVAGAAGGKAIDTALHIGPNKESTEAAYAGLWQSRSGQAMELAALTGDPNAVLKTYRTAAGVSAKYGYSAEEGMEAMKQAARQGLDGKEAAEVAGRAFDYERRTGADRETLMGISAMSARYGAGDALKAGWAGLQASGMSAGQYNEYLRAMQRVMEEGISKGFVRSSEQVAQNLAMLSQMTGNDPLWQGENGARRLSEMNSGLEGSTALSSTSDIIAFRAAKNLAMKNNLGGSYIEAMKILEGGLTPELFGEYMKIAGSAEGGAREGIVERMRQTFGLNYTNADTLYKSWDENKGISKDDFKNIMESFKPLSADNPYLKAAATIEEIKNWWTETGISKWEAGFPNMLLEELRKAKREYNKETGSNVPVTAGNAPVPGVIPGRTAGVIPGRIPSGNAANAWTSGDIDRIDSFRHVAGTMFDFFGSKSDTESYKKLAALQEATVRSGDSTLVGYSDELTDIFTRTPKDVRKKLNEDDTLNALIGNSKDLAEFVSALRTFVTASREFSDELRKGIVLE
jgi:hypothetical protein